MINKTKTECETKLCQYDSLTRTRFYNGMLLTAEHLRAEQAYHRESLKRLNRNLFGSGIVCGLEVEIQPRGLCLTVHPGVALDCCGNLVEVCKCVTVDLSKVCKDEYGSQCLPPPDPQNPDQNVINKYLVLRYDEKLTDPEQVFTPGDECKAAGEKTNCEASKIREGFCIELWDRCPCPEDYPEPNESLLETLKKGRKAMSQMPGGGSTPAPAPAPPGQGAANLRASMGRRGQLGLASETTDGRKDCIDLPLPCSSCGCCEDSNAVGLAKLKINCAQSTIEIVECECRRYVISPRLLVWLFSRFPLRRNIPAEMDDVYTHLGYRPVAQMMGTAVGFEKRGDTLREHEEKIALHTDQVSDLEKRIRVLEQPPPAPPTPRDTEPPPDKQAGSPPSKRAAKKAPLSTAIKKE
jgi:hypothetical protein